MLIPGPGGQLSFLRWNAQNENAGLRMPGVDGVNAGCKNVMGRDPSHSATA